MTPPAGRPYLERGSYRLAQRPGVSRRSLRANRAPASNVETPAGDIMRREFEMADSNEMLEPAFIRLQTCDCHTMPVMSRGKLVGLLTSDNMGEFLMIQSALSKTDRRERHLAPRG